MTTMTDSEALAVLDDAVHTVIVVSAHGVYADIGACKVDQLRQARAHIAEALRDAAIAPKLLTALIEIMRISDRDHEAWHAAKKVVSEAIDHA